MICPNDKTILIKDIMIPNGNILKCPKCNYSIQLKRDGCVVTPYLINNGDTMNLTLKEKVLKDRYLQPGETEQDMYMRVANAITKDTDKVMEYYDVMSNGLFLPNTPTLVNAGRDVKKNLSACFVVPINDSLDSIYEALEAQGKIHSSFGGTGFDFSEIRPKGTLIESTGGKATGPVGFMKLFNENATAVRQGGIRDGGNMGILRVDHPDILEFIECKSKEGVLSHFNISVALTDEFMEAIERNGLFNLTWNNKIVKTVDAITIFNNICKCAHKTGEPGIIFIDEINNKDKLTHLAPICSTNPCVIGSTLIQTVEGNIPIHELVGKTVDVYCIDPDTYELKISTATDIRITKRNTSLVEVVTSRQNIICTPDHKFYTKNEGWVEAQFLTKSHKIVGLNKFPRNIRHTMVMLTGSDRSNAIAEHRFIAGHYNDIEGMDVHHINGDCNDNRLSNLEVLSHSEHSSITNIGHQCYAGKDKDTGKFTSDGHDGYKCSNALHINSKGVNLRVKEINKLDYMMNVYDMNIDKYHNFIANGIVIHNCGEQPLRPYESCNLGSINLSNMLITKDDELRVDWNKLERVTKIAVMFLNDVIDSNEYPLEVIKDATLLTRNIGLGVMGWHDMLIKMGIAYDSVVAVSMAESIMARITDTAVYESEQLSEFHGLYPASVISGLDDIKPRRNATLTTIAPTGTLSILAKCSSGIEPIFSWDYERNVESGSFDIENDMLSIAKAHDDECMMKVAQDFSYESHINMQAAFQAHVHNAVSKTINMSSDCSVDDIRKAILYAHGSKCKGITIYRNGSRDDQVLVDKIDKSHKTGMDKFVNDYIGKQMKVDNKRPDIMYGKTSHKQSGCGKLFITANSLNNKPAELFVHHSDGGCQSNMEAIGRLISLCLKHEIESNEIVEQLSKIKCVNAMKSKSDGRSCPHIIGMVLEQSTNDEHELSVFHDSDIIEDLNKVPDHKKFTVDTLVMGNVCPKCYKPLDFGEGCMKGQCNYCGWTGCN